MNYEEIAAMLAAGKSADEIAKEFTDALNKATVEQKAAEEAKAKEEAKSHEMNEIAVAVTDALNRYIKVAGIDTEELRASEVREWLDEFLPVLEQFKNVKIRVAKAGPSTRNALKSADQILNSWLKDLGF